MKIMYLLFSFTVGGTERLITNVCNEMVRRENDVYLYIVNDLYTQELLDSLDPRVHLELQKRAVGGGDKLKTLQKIAAYIRKNQIDVVHCNSLESPELLLLSKKLRPKTKVFYTIHGMGQYATLGQQKVDYRNRICDGIFAISDSVRDDILASGADEKKVTVVYDAINLEQFDGYERKPFDENRIVLGNVARINLAQKGQDILLKAFAALSKKYPMECYFAGSDASKDQRDLHTLKALAQELGVADQVHFVGTIHNVPEFLSKLDIFVLPSRTEGFGVSLSEAMAMDLTCVASRLDGPAELLGDNERGILFEPENVDALCEALEQAIHNCRNNITLNASAYVRSKFDIRTMCEVQLKLYRGEN